MTDQMTTTVKSRLHRVELAIENGPSITDAFGRETRITGVTLTYSDGAVTGIRLDSGEVAVFVDDVDLAQPKSWPTWLHDLVIEYGQPPTAGEAR